MFIGVFPGQGFNNIIILRRLIKTFSICKPILNQASEIVNYDLFDLINQDQLKGKLNFSYYSQIIVLISSVLIWKIWKDKNGMDPLFLVGHSLGEYSVLVCAGVLDFRSVVKLVKKRAILMEQSIPNNDGIMAVVVGLSEKDVLYICKIYCKEEFVSPVIFNSSNQIVIAGHKRAVKRSLSLCCKYGAKFVRILPINIPSHCKLMKSAADKLDKEFQKLKFIKPQIPVFDSVNFNCTRNVNCIRKSLIYQLYNPIYWSKIIEYFVFSKNIKSILEFGISNVLTKLNREIVGNKLLYNFSVKNIIFSDKVIEKFFF